MLLKETVPRDYLYQQLEFLLGGRDGGRARRNELREVGFRQHQPCVLVKGVVRLPFGGPPCPKQLPDLGLDQARRRVKGSVWGVQG